MNRELSRLREEVPPMRYTIEIEREDDGRWIAEVPELPA